MFREIDTDVSGQLDKAEFIVGCQALGVPLSADKLRDAFRSFDADGSGSVSYGELFSATRLSATKAGAVSLDETAQQRRFWYVSEEKLEPRLGDRFDDPGAERESPLDIARRVQALWRALEGVTDLRAFRAARPEHELALARVACLSSHPYAEIRDNLIAESCLPIDMLRSKLAFFGATKFDPKSDRWTRITLAQGAPLPEDLGTARADDWWLAGYVA